MSLSIFIDTATSKFSILFDQDDEIIFNSSKNEELAASRNIHEIMSRGMEITGKKLEDIALLLVNIGPGGTNAVRSGIAFANSLAYTLKIPVAPYNSYEMLGYGLWSKHQLPVIGTSKAINGNAFLGLYDNNEVKEMRFGKIEDIIKTLDIAGGEVLIAGAHREQLMTLMDHLKVHDTEIINGTVADLVPLKPLLRKRKLLFPDFVKPLTENSKEFNESK